MSCRFQQGRQLVGLAACEEVQIVVTNKSRRTVRAASERPTATPGEGVILDPAAPGFADQAASMGLTPDELRAVLGAGDDAPPAPATASAIEQAAASGARTETFVTTRADGSQVRVWRNIETGEQRVTEIEGARTDA